MGGPGCTRPDSNIMHHEPAARATVGRLWTQRRTHGLDDDVWNGCLYGIYGCTLGTVMSSSSFTTRAQRTGPGEPGEGATRRPVSMPAFSSLSALDAAWAQGSSDDASVGAGLRERMKAGPKQDVRKDGLDLAACCAVRASLFSGDFADFG
jgi:hypothetical protein